MNILSPSILSANFAELGNQMKAVERGGAQYIHIDVMDGMLVPTISYGMPVIKSIRDITDLVFDVHLMIIDPIRYIKDFVDAGADIITFHYESTNDARAVINEIHKYGKKAGMAIKPETSVEAFRPYLNDLEQLLVMTVEPGFGGQQYIDYCTDKVRNTRAMLDMYGLKTDIQVDGGINIATVHHALDAGANVIVAGSAIFKGNIEERTRKFLEIMG
ncbi:MAG: ribulose-phosphate 3-epimerase [Butyrivibrio sp.]|jgi:ribulose-phosphate 3-epimerase|nr:ribulose-phosphate 3-epimerase [Butyrivibrio sp.]MBQ7430495.1 ribulose-phosphate 3-epimerase [Butyrivibrio sp.]